MTEKEQHIIYNGEIVSSAEPVIFHKNRSFCYGDGLFETMHAFGTEVQFADMHFQRLYSGMNVLRMNIDEAINQQKIIHEVKRLLNREKLFGGTRIRLTVFRDSKGFYTPEENNVSYIIECLPLETDYYQLNNKGLAIGVFKNMVKQIGLLSKYKTANSLLFVMAGIYSRENNFNDCLILNERGNIIESTHSNVFIVKGNKIATPSLEEGCVAGIMRDQVLHIAQDSGFHVVDGTSFTEGKLLEADEIFLTNAIEGIRWVVAFRQKRYYNKIAKLIIEQLNKEVFK